MNPWVVKNFIYIPIYKIRGERISKCRKEVQAFHSLNAGEMSRIQWAKLKSLLEFVSRSNPYYRELFARQGLKAEDIRCPDDLHLIPPLTKEVIKKNSGLMISEGRWRLSRRKTSGSTGIPLYFPKDRIASAYMDAVMYEVYGWYGIKMGDRQSRIWGMPLNMKARMRVRLKDLILNRKRLAAFDISPKQCLRFYRELERFKPKYVYGVVNTICEFARVIMEAGLNPADLGIKTVLTTGEILHPRHASFLYEAFRVPVVNEYGTTENGIIAFQCPHGEMHLMSHNFYLEFLDPQTGQPVQPGRIGEVVLTELHSYAFPFIRYRIGDLVRPSEDNCDCGLGLPLIKEVIGRTSDLITLPDGSRLSSAIVSYAVTNGVNKFRTYQKSPDRLEILLQVNQCFREGDLTIMENKLRTHLPDEMSIDFQIVNDIPKDISGKFREFTSEI
jgi:phenylacetate-CoA ligase